MSKKPLPTALVATRPAVLEDLDGEHPANGEKLGAPPSRYTAAVHDAIVASIKSFQRPVVAASMAGIPSATFYAWMKRGKEGDPFLKQFFEDVEAAIAVAEGAAVDKILNNQETAPEDMKWFLERRHPEAYSKDVAARVNGELEIFVKRLEAGLDPATFEKVLAVFAGLPTPALPSAHDSEKDE